MIGNATYDMEIARFHMAEREREGARMRLVNLLRRGRRNA
jgi:hypothetical protein